jgi:hypothetical protein
MLNKKICFKCFKDDFKENNFYFSEGQLKQLEEDWGKGEICCFPVQQGILTSIKDFPPENCPYIVEQMMN